jgi:signal peptidase I
MICGALSRLLLIEVRQVTSNSMYPTLHVRDHFAVEKISQRARPPRLPERGEVFLFRLPPSEREDQEKVQKTRTEIVVKRIVAVEGDTVQVRSGDGLYVNGARQADACCKDEPPQYSWGPRTVPEGRVFVLGDNRNDSDDGHEWGFLRRENIIGRALFAHWPTRRRKLL